MSIDAMAYAWKTELSGSVKLMLLAIADRCDEFGMCFPGVDKLAKKCGVKKRAAQKLISKLEELGELVVIVGDGTKTVSGKTNRYFMKKFRDSLNMKTPNVDTRDVQTYTPQKDDEVSKRTSHEMSNDSPDGVSDSTPNTTEDTTGDTKILSATQSDRDRLFDGIAYIAFGLDAKSDSPDVKALLKKSGGRIGKIKKFLTSLDEPCTADELWQFHKWYKHKYPDADLPRDDTKFAEHFIQFRAGVTQQPVSSNPTFKPMDLEAPVEVSQDEIEKRLAELRKVKEKIAG